MFVALLKNGETISLLEGWTMRELQRLRGTETFYCPLCRGEVVLKLGNKRVHHFAHKKDTICATEYEPESLYHMKGKKDLYTWVKNQGFTVEVEPYIQPIHQRPDILIRDRRKTYALEFQCSPISEQLFKKRTSAYLKAGIQPIWIHGASRLRYISSHTVNLPSFHWLFAQPHPFHSHCTIPYYCPHSKRFLFLFPMYPLSVTRTFSLSVSQQLDHLLFDGLFKRDCSALPDLFWDEWLSQKKKWRLFFTLYPNKTTRYICSFFYRHNVTPALFPSEAGLPQKYGYLFETPIFIWQTIVLISVLKSQKRKGFFTFGDIYSTVKPFIHSRKLKLRTLPLMGNVPYLRAINEYIEILTQLGYIKKEKQATFCVRKAFTFPKTMDEAIKKDHDLLVNIKKGKVGI